MTKSNCCKAEMENECADEGTCCFRCLKCGNATDPYIEPNNLEWEKEFCKIYLLQQWTEGNSDQAIFISPTLQKTHRDLCLQFISNLLAQKLEESVERLNDRNITTIYCGKVMASQDNPMVPLKDVLENLKIILK